MKSIDITNTRMQLGYFHFYGNSHLIDHADMPKQAVSLNMR